MTFAYKNIIAFHHIILCIYNPQHIYLSRFPLRISHLEFYIYRTIWNWISSIQVAYRVLMYYMSMGRFWDKGRKPTFHNAVFELEAIILVIIIISHLILWCTVKCCFFDLQFTTLKKLILRNKRSIKEDYTSTSNLCVRCFRVWRNLLTLVFDLRKLILMLFVRTFSKKKKIKWHFISYFASRELFTIIWPQIGELFRININVFSCF